MGHRDFLAVWLVDVYSHVVTLEKIYEKSKNYFIRYSIFSFANVLSSIII